MKERSALVGREDSSRMSATWIPPPFRSRGPARTLAVVVAIAALLLLAFLGYVVLAGSGGGGNPPGGLAVTSTTAERLATSQLGPGPWQLLVAEGFDLWNGTTVETNTSSTIPGCTVSYTTPLPPATIAYPAYRGDLSTGAAAIWTLLYIQPASYTLGLSLIIDGAQELGVQVSGANCQLFPAISNFTALPAGVIDSSAAARAIDQSGGTQFLASYRDYLSLTMILADFSSPSGPGVPIWGFSFDPCGGPFSFGSTGPPNASSFDGAVYAMNGTVEQAGQYRAFCAPVPPPTGSGMFPFMPGLVQLVHENRTGATIPGQGCTRGDYCYELSIDQPYENDTPSDFDLSVLNSTSVTSSFVVGYAILDPNGTVLVYEIGAQETSWARGAGTPTTPLLPGDSLWIDMGPSDPSGAGFSLNAQGVGPYQGFTAGYGLP